MRLISLRWLIPMWLFVPVLVPGHGVTSEGVVPQAKATEPDCPFAGAADWDDRKAEILSYDVKRATVGGQVAFKAQMVTEKIFTRGPAGAAMRMPAGKAESEILNSTLSYAWNENGTPHSAETIVKVPRHGTLRLLRQDQSMQSWPDAKHTVLDCRSQQSRLQVLSSAGDPAVDTVLNQWPLFTEEMLFTYLRALPQRAGYREEIWMLENPEPGESAPKVQFATIAVRSRAAGIRDMETWYVTVDREDGKRSEYWLSEGGLHQVVMAILPDKSSWLLEGIARKKYWM